MLEQWNCLSVFVAQKAAAAKILLSGNIIKRISEVGRETG